MKLSAKNRRMAGLLIAVLVSGCTTSHYRKSADREVYGAIRQKTPLVQNMDPEFTLEQTNVIALAGLPLSTNVPDYLGPEGQRERGASVLRLEDSLDIAVHSSRSFQNRKEQLYLSALSLTSARHQFAPLFSGAAAAEYSVDRINRVVTVGTNQVVTDDLVEQHTVGGGASLNVSWLIRDVGRISAAFTADFLRFVTGDPRVVSSSQLSAQFVRPLLRDAGFKQEQEALVLAERQLLYDLREFTQFRKDFSVQVATAFYGVLGSRDTARNTYLNFQSSRKNAERARAMVAEGRTTTAELGRLEQQELSAESAWIGALRNYRQLLDNFKFLLGLSVEDNLVLDERELEALKILHPDINVDDSISVALAGRLDYLNARDQFEDAERQVRLTANLLRPGLNLTGGVSVRSDPDNNNYFAAPDFSRYHWNAGLDLDPGLDRQQERNDYRSALISCQRAARQVEQQEDQIKLQVRDSWRTLDQAKRNYEISDIGVQIAERRVEEQNLLADLGRAKAQDQVDAQNALIDSKNQRTQALVTHTIARLQFWNNMGILYIKANGQWEEMSYEKTP